VRVISLVPSWTETLLEAGVNVVGRTRFCIHPSERVKNIPIVGGTKSWDLEKIRALKPDLILLDQEENPKSMADEAPCPWLATHVSAAADMPRELERLGEALKAPSLSDLKKRWERCLAKPQTAAWTRVPGFIEWINAPKLGAEPKKFVYLIWKPYMAASQATFIGSMWQLLGWEEQMLDFPAKYPEVKLEDFDPQTTALFFSTEPYPFQSQIAEIKKLPHKTCLVNGEAFSWFGLRSLRFLENYSKS
jgi:ABC-type Fe3+-hydroxamate transport system substrate-binding protein